MSTSQISNSTRCLNTPEPRPSLFGGGDVRLWMANDECLLQPWGLLQVTPKLLDPRHPETSEKLHGGRYSYRPLQETIFRAGI